MPHSELDYLASLSPIDRLKIEMQIRGLREVSPDERQANINQSVSDVLGIVPIMGNLLAAKDAYQSGRSAVEAFQADDWRRGALDSALAGLSGVGAVAGLPVSRMAGNVAKHGNRTLFSGAGPMGKPAMSLIYTDHMGAFAPDITLSTRRGQTYRKYSSKGEEVVTEPTTYYFSGTQKNFPLELQQQFSSLDEAERAAETLGFFVQNRKIDGYGRPFLQLSHNETARQFDEAIRASDEKWKGATDVFLRYGAIPRGGRSRNFADNSLEPGVSVYRGKLLPGGEARVIPSTNMELAGSYAFEGKRPLYVIEGDVAGAGSDGEPVLRNARIIREVKGSR